MSHLNELESNPYASPATIGSVEMDVDRIDGMPYASQNKHGC